MANDDEDTDPCRFVDLTSYSDDQVSEASEASSEEGKESEPVGVDICVDIEEIASDAEEEDAVNVRPMEESIRDRRNWKNTRQENHSHPKQLMKRRQRRVAAAALNADTISKKRDRSDMQVEQRTGQAGKKPTVSSKASRFEDSHESIVEPLGEASDVDVVDLNNDQGCDEREGQVCERAAAAHMGCSAVMMGEKNANSAGEKTDLQGMMAPFRSGATPWSPAKHQRSDQQKNAEPLKRRRRMRQRQVGTNGQIGKSPPTTTQRTQSHPPNKLRSNQGDHHVSNDKYLDGALAVGVDRYKNPGDQNEIRAAARQGTPTTQSDNCSQRMSAEEHGTKTTESMGSRFGVFTIMTDDGYDADQGTTEAKWLSNHVAFSSHCNLQVDRQGQDGKTPSQNTMPTSNSSDLAGNDAVLCLNSNECPAVVVQNPTMPTGRQFGNIQKRKSAPEHSRSDKGSEKRRSEGWESPNVRKISVTEEMAAKVGFNPDAKSSCESDTSRESQSHPSASRNCDQPVEYTVQSHTSSVTTECKQEGTRTGTSAGGEGAAPFTGPNFIVIEDDSDDDDDEVEVLFVQRVAKVQATQQGTFGINSPERRGFAVSSCDFGNEPKNLNRPIPPSRTNPSERMFNAHRDYNFEISCDAAQEMQERLLRDCVARLKSTGTGLPVGDSCPAPTASTNPKSTAPSIGVPIPDVHKLYPDHWKWKDPFARLGLPRRSSARLVKTQYRKLALVYHPDKFKYEDSTRRFHAITDAYRKLTA